MLSPAHPELSGIDRLASEAPRQIANAHTVFNIANTLIFIGMTGQFARLVEWLVPDRPIEEEVIIQAKYLDEELIDTPSLALGRVRLEMGHMGERVREMLQKILPAIVSGDREKLKEIAKIDDEVDILHGDVVTYLGSISQKALTEDQTHELVNLMAAVNDLENIGDIIETDLVHLGNERIRDNVTISAQTQAMLKKLHDAVSSTADKAFTAVTENNERAAQEVILMKADINRMMDSAAMHEAQRLVAAEPDRLPAYSLEMDIIEKLKRIYYFSKRMAKAVMPEEVLEHEV
jgi:phosphate:Na+ symporter